MIAQSRNAFEERGERFRLVAQTIPSGSAGRFRLANTSQNHLCLVVMMMNMLLMMMDDDGHIWQTNLRLRARDPSRRNQNARAIMNRKR